jgi:hypothetical protein
LALPFSHTATETANIKAFFGQYFSCTAGMLAHLIREDDDLAAMLF